MESVENYERTALGKLIYQSCILKGENMIVYNVSDGLQYIDIDRASEMAAKLRGGSTNISYTEYKDLGHIELMPTNDKSHADLKVEDIQKAENKAKEIAEEAMKKYPNSPVDQLNHMNRWLCDNCTYSIGTLGNTGNDAYGALIERKAVCEGYALAVALICDELGIPNVLIYTDMIKDGTSHCYNQVYVDKKWSIIDVTWNDTDGDRWKYFLCKRPCSKYAEYYEEYYEDIKKLRYQQLVDEQLEWLNKQAKDNNIDISRITSTDNISREATRLDLATIAGLLGTVGGIENKISIKDNMPSDVKTSDIEAVAQCYQLGFMNGISSTKFDPNGLVSKYTMCIVMERVLGVEAINPIEYAVNNSILYVFRTNEYDGERVRIYDLIDTAYRVGQILTEGYNVTR